MFGTASSRVVASIDHDRPVLYIGSEITVKLTKVS